MDGEGLIGGLYTFEGSIVKLDMNLYFINELN